MKQATRIQRRLDREENEKQYHMQREQALKQISIANRNAFIKATVKTVLWISVFVVPMGFIIHHDNIEADKRKAEINLKLSAWNEYKNKNCKEVEKLYGMQMGSGKFRYVDNGTVYQCANELKYTVSDKAAKGEMGMDSIPEVKN